jgi:ankyrin repeat protein
LKIYFSPRRPSTDGTGGVEAWDGLTPLHLACMAGLDKIVQFLVQENAQVNIQVRVKFQNNLLCKIYFSSKQTPKVNISCVSQK